MTINMFEYLFQATIVFSVLYILYRLVFSKLTFHVINRGVLLAILLLSIGIPLLTSITPPMMYSIREIPQLFEQISAISTIPTVTPRDQHLKPTSFDYMVLVYSIYFLGVGICLLRFFMSMYRLLCIKKLATSIKRDDQVLYEAPVTDIFSYFHWIFIPKKMTYDPLILIHEKAHSKLWHTVDILLVEMYITFFWWNPLVYLYRKSLKSIQADQYVLREQIKTSDYLQLIAQSLEIKRPNQLYNYFNTPILKKRIHMMTRKTSHYSSKLTYFLIVPLCALCFIAFTKPITEHPILEDVVKIIEHTEITPTFAFPIEGSSTQQITAFFNADIKDPTTKKTKLHTGIDIKAAIGTPIVATANGKVTLAKNQDAWGNLIKIQHLNNYETWYAHLKAFTVSTGQSVKKGDVIGYVGMTGKSSGPHLHYELKYHKKSINPLKYLEK